MPKLERSVPFEEGVKYMKVAVATKEVTVMYDGQKTDKEKFRKSIERLGHTASELGKEGSKGK